VPQCRFTSREEKCEIGEQSRRLRDDDSVKMRIRKHCWGNEQAMSKKHCIKITMFSTEETESKHAGQQRETDRMVRNSFEHVQGLGGRRKGACPRTCPGEPMEGACASRRDPAGGAYPRTCPRGLGGGAPTHSLPLGTMLKVRTHARPLETSPKVRTHAHAPWPMVRVRTHALL
jgi:hypothetical protein